MNDELRQEIYDHAIAQFPREACGLVVDNERYSPCRNIARTANEHFVLHPADYAAAEDSGKITCVVHSHPNMPAEPSQGDMVACERGGLPWLIVAVWKQPEDAVPHVVGDYAFEPTGYEAPLLGRQFFFGVLDCYTLVQDWYKREQMIDLPHFERRDEFWKNNASQIDLYAQYGDAGFAEVPAGEPLRVGDVILMQIRAPFANHAGVYVGNGKMLHHLSRKLSTLEVYPRSYWQDVTRRIVRYAR